MVRRVKSSRPHEPARVLYVNHTAVMGGAEIALCRLLAVLDRDRFEPVVCLFEDGPLRARLAALDVEVHVLPLDPALLAVRKHSVDAAWLLRPAKVLSVVRHARRLARLIADEEIDLVHTNSLKAHVVGAVGAWLANRPLVWHLHTRIASDYLPRFAVLCLRYGCRFVPDRVVCNSRATLATVRPRKRQATVIFPGMPTDDGDLRSPDGPPPFTVAGTGGPVTVGIIGVLSAFKGQDVFLRAAALLRPRFPEVRFQIVGSTLFGEQAYEAALHRLVVELELGDAVTFSGYRTDAVAVMRGLAVVVHASRTPEPFGQVLIEAMATGRPVVATAGGGVAEVVVDGETGLIVPPNDPHALATAIGAILADPRRAAVMGWAGQARVAARFGIGRTVTQMQRLYHGLLWPSRRPASRPLPGLEPIHGTVLPRPTATPPTPSRIAS